MTSLDFLPTQMMHVCNRAALGSTTLIEGPLPITDPLAGGEKAKDQKHGP